jgi:hypothetical protein
MANGEVASIRDLSALALNGEILDGYEVESGEVDSVRDSGKLDSEQPGSGKSGAGPSPEIGLSRGVGTDAQIANRARLFFDQPGPFG